jgi:pimeloyl-[acyl-carrier protein] methyl ester esterase
MLYSKSYGLGENLVFLHGWGFNSDVFINLTNKYKDQYRITLIDLPGHGRSDNVNGDIDDWRDEIIKILPKNPILVGWSLGGLFAIKIADKIPIKKIILIASTPKFVKSNEWEYGIKKSDFLNFSNAMKNNLSKQLKRFVSLQTKNKEQIKIINNLINKYPANIQALEQGIDFLLNSNLISEFEKIKIPKEVILGANDKLIPIGIKKFYSAQKIPIKILNCGHIPFIENDFSF